MEKLKVYLSLLAFCCLLSAGVAQAQQEMTAKKFENPEWKQVMLVKFEPESIERAKEIIRNYFVKADIKAGRQGPSVAVDLVTGEWDMMLVWDMKGGIEDLNWETSPDDVKWMTAMNDIAGGKDKARALLKEWSSTINRSTSYIGRTAK